MIVIPKVLGEKDIITYQKGIKQCILKSIEHSLWCCDNTIYKECSMSKKDKVAFEVYSSPLENHEDGYWID